MYQVSENYIAAMRASSIIDKVYGRIFLKSGNAIDITDESIAQGKLSITRKVCGNALKIGTFYVSTMSITLFDNAAYDNEWAGAMIVLKYSVLIDEINDVWEDVPLGPFFVDGKESRRRGGQIALTAYDNASKFDIALPDLGAITTLWGALQAAYYKANVGIAMNEDEFNSLPNAAIVPDFSSAKIQTCRDLVMWIAQSVGGYAYINNQGLLAIKRYAYDGGNTYDRLITAQERTDIEYTDTRTYLAYLSAYCDGDPKNYTKITEWTGTDASHTKEGALSLSDNPLFASLSSDEQDAVNEAVLSARPYPTRYIKAQGFVDPAIEPLDVLAFSGGNIDIGQIISTCTEIKWKFRGIGTIICNNFEEYSEDASESAVSLSSETSEASADNSNVKVQPKSQTEKRIDALEKGLKQCTTSTAIAPLTAYELLSDTSVKCNDITYTIETDSATGLISKITDSLGGKLVPTYKATPTDVDSHNFMLWAVAMAKGLRSGTKLYLMSAASETTLAFTNGLTGFYKASANLASNIQTNSYDGVPYQKLSKVWGFSRPEDGYYDTMVVRSNEKIDLSGYNTLAVKAALFADDDPSEGYTFLAEAYVGFGDTAMPQSGVAYDFSGWQKIISTTESYLDFAVDSDSVPAAKYEWHYVDVSNIEGEQYLNFAVYHGGEIHGLRDDHTMIMYVAELYLQ